MSRRRPDKALLMLTGALIAPSLLVVAGHRFEIPAGPLMSQAATTEPIPVPVNASGRKSPAQETAAVRVAELAEELFNGNPLFYPPSIEQQSGDSTDVDGAEILAGLEATVTSIARGGDGRMFAVINGRIHKEGDSLIKGWRLVKIDAASRMITVESESGEQITVDLERPELRDDT